MIYLKNRSHKKELLDGENIPFDDIKKNMQELDKINTLLGGHKITIKGVKNIITHSSIKKSEISIVEIGCGGGDNLKTIKEWSSQNNIQTVLTGIDINKECIAYARCQNKNAGINFICSDYKKVTFSTKPHIIFSSLFCHHFSEKELMEIILWKNNNAELGFFINDLHRHPIALYSIKILTKLFSKSYLVKNDAPLSVQRSFIRKDWKEIFEQMNLTNYEINWQWAYRWLVTCYK